MSGIWLYSGLVTCTIHPVIRSTNSKVGDGVKNGPYRKTLQARFFGAYLTVNATSGNAAIFSSLVNKSRDSRVIQLRKLCFEAKCIDVWPARGFLCFRPRQNWGEVLSRDQKAKNGL